MFRSLSSPNERVGTTNKKETIERKTRISPNSPCMRSFTSIYMIDEQQQVVWEKEVRLKTKTGSRLKDIGTSNKASSVQWGREAKNKVHGGPAFECPARPILAEVGREQLYLRFFCIMSKGNAL